MSERTLRGIVLALVVLVVLYVGVRLVGGGASGAGAADTAELAAFLERIDPDAIQEVILARETDTLRLTREGDGWRVNGYEIDTVQVRRFWEDLTDAKAGDLVARNPANHERLGVSDEKAKALTLRWPGGDEATLLFGNPGPGWTNSYVRLPGRDEVYLLRGDVRSHVTRGLTQWRNRLIVALDTALVEWVSVRRDGREYALERDSTGWRMAGDTVSASRVRTLLGELARLQATDFAPDTLSFPDPERILVAGGGPGDTLAVLEFAPAPGTSWWTRRPDRETIYKISSWRTAAAR